MSESARAVAVALAAIAVVGACDDPTTVRASAINVESLPVLYAMNGTPITLPSAVRLQSGSAVRIDAAFAFDLAFDMDASGVVTVYTQRMLANELTATHRVGLQTRVATFDEVIKAPSSGFVYDSLLTLGQGEILLVDVAEGVCAGSFVGSNIKGKMRVDSVNKTTRSIFLHILSNPNCGFKSLVQGTPKD